jgi:hypothetical protein
MLIKLQERPGASVIVPGLPPGVLPLEPVQFKYRQHGRWARLLQFPVVLAYAITDFKCQGSTFSDGILVDLKKPVVGPSPSSSAYVQLSRATSLNKVFIIRPFDTNEFRKPLSKELLEELQWQETMFEITRQKFPQEK